MVFRRGYRRFRRQPRRRIYRRKGIKRVSKATRAYVKRAIHRQIENKEILDYWANNTVRSLGTSNNDGTACHQLLPLPAQGTADNQRIGNAIKVVSGKLKMSMNLKPYDATFNPVGTPVEVRFIIFRDLSQSATQNIYTNTTYFDTFWRGNGTTVGIQGTKLDLMLPVDDTRFRVLFDRTYKLGAASNTSTGPVGSGGYMDNSPMTKTVTINWAKWVKKQLKWTDGGSYPTNDNLYFVVLPIRADGDNSSGYKLIETHGVNHIKYEDA